MTNQIMTRTRRQLQVIARSIIVCLIVAMPAYSSDEFVWAPAQEIGSTFPDITLTANDGKPVTLDELKGERATLLIFSRSTDW